MHTAPFPAGRGRDRCPGALALHEAADGLLARVRLPGGRADATVLRGIARLAVDCADGTLELTSRGNVQLRGIAADRAGELADRLADLGLLPSARHETVRNIVASPLAEIDSQASAVRDADGLVADLDSQLCARAELAELPGRFLFGIDDGRGDVLSLDVDVVIRSGHTTGESVLFPGGFTVSTSDAVHGALVIAQTFLEYRDAVAPGAWRIADLPEAADFRRATADALSRSGIEVTGGVTREASTASLGPAGVIPQPDGRVAVAVVVPLGRLSASQAELLAEFVTGRAARITPWRQIVIPDQADAAPLVRAATDLGLGTDADSVWYGLSACVGSPGCVKALADVRADASQCAESSRRAPAEVRTELARVHWSGCERRCGRPSAAYLDILATADGYVITETGATP